MDYLKIDEARKQIDKENQEMIQTSKGWVYEFNYRGYLIMILRARQYGHLCGYIKVNVLKDSTKYRTIDNHFHGRVSFHDKQWIGFDCLHSEDFSPHQYEVFSYDSDFDLSTFFKDRHYRTLNEVKQYLVSTVDALIEEKAKNNSR